MVLLTILVASISASTFSAEFKATICWKGLSQEEQDSNLERCKKQKEAQDICSTQLFEHGGAAYDVCLMKPTGPLSVVHCYKGFSQKEQNENQGICEESRRSGQICSTDVWTHKGAVYDVCLME